MNCFFRNQHEALYDATKPYQYVGGEFLSRNKDFDSAKVRFAFVFPDKYEIGIAAVRGGTIVGEHEVIFAGQDEVIEFKHTAYSKAVFAKGAVEAAKFLNGKPAGYYGMADVIAAK